MAGEVRTSLVLTAETKGFDKALRQTLGLNQKALEGLKQQSAQYKKAQAEVKGMEDELKGLIKQQAELGRKMEEVGDKGSKGYQKMEAEMRKFRDRAKEVSSIIQTQERAYAGEARAARQLEQALSKITNQQQRQKELSRWAGTQGFVQGLGMGEYFQRGPGMGRQIMGRMLGGGVRRGVGAAWGMTGGAAFTGVQGMQQGLAGIPIVGGFLSGQLGAAAGYAQQALQYQRQRLEMLPYIGGAGAIQRATAVRGQEGARKRARQQEGQMLREFNLQALESEYQQGLIPKEEYEKERWMLTEGPASYYNPVTGKVLAGREGTRRKWEEEIPEALGDIAGGTYRKPKFDIPGYWSGVIFGTPEERQKRKAIETRNYIQSQLRKDPKWREAVARGEVSRVGTEELNRMARGGYSDVQEEAIRKQGEIEDRGRRARERLQREYTAERKQAARRIWKAQEAPFQTPAMMGRELRGLGRQEALQETMQFAQAAGGTFTGQFPGERRALRASMAARTLYGVGYETTGAFQMAARRGGLVGGRGRGGEEITEALADAVRLGLGGSEITQYMQVVAQGIQQFQQTGIPMAKDSLRDMAGALQFGGGMGATRALATARGFQQMVQGMGARGPTGGLDLMLMQEFGGYTGEGGPEALEKAFIQMERMGEAYGKGGVEAMASDEAMSNVMRRIIGMGGGGAGGRMFLRRQLAGRGINIGAQEMSILGKRLEGIELTPEEAAMAKGPEEARGKAPTSLKDLTTTAKDAVTGMAPNLRKQAALQDKQLAVGQAMASTVQNLEMSAANTSKAFANLAGETLQKLTGGLEKFTQQLEGLTAEGGGLVKMATILGIS